MSTTTPVATEIAAQPAAPARKRRNRVKKEVVPAVVVKKAKPKAVLTPKPVAKVAKPKQAAPKPAESKPLKPKKIKLVRDSFTIPKSEFLVLEELKLRGNELKISVKKSELLRAGIKALAAMDNDAFLQAVKAVPLLKAGRPSK